MNRFWGGLLSLASWGVCTLFDRGIAASGFIWKFLARINMLSVHQKSPSIRFNSNNNNDNNNNSNNSGS